MEQISEDGTAKFDEIPKTFFASGSGTEIWFEDAKGAYRMDKRLILYQIPPGENFNVTVAQSCIREIYGIVKDSLNQKRLSGVKLEMQGISFRTNANGAFKLLLPNAKQLPMAKLSAKRQGYKIWEKMISWEEAEQEMVLLMQSIPQKLVVKEEGSTEATTKEELERTIQALMGDLEDLKEDHQTKKITNKDYVNKSSALKLQIEKLERQLK